jgi:uncharacterized membrane-anchored protein
MRLTARRPRAGTPGTTTGTVRVDRRTRRLAGRLRPGDIALIDHVDLDRPAAEVLVAARVAAVLNARPSISGRIPNLGPQLLIGAGIELVDDLGDGVFQQVRDGDEVTVYGSTVLRNGTAVAYGVRQDAESVAKAVSDARDGLSVQLEAFAATAVEYVRRQRGLFLDGLSLPRLRTRVDGRPCVVVLRRPADRSELKDLARYLADVEPVLIGVDAGADALLESGHQPDLVVGDLESVSDRALRCGAELVARTGVDGRTPGAARLGALNLRAVAVPAAATPEDFGLLLADAAGASLIVAVGGRADLTELLDHGRTGAASAFLTRVKLGERLVDARTVARLHRPRASPGTVVALAGTAIIAMATGAVATTIGSSVLDHLAMWWDRLFVAL